LNPGSPDLRKKWDPIHSEINPHIHIHVDMKFKLKVTRYIYSTSASVEGKQNDYDFFEFSFYEQYRHDELSNLFPRYDLPVFNSTNSN